MTVVVFVAWLSRGLVDIEGWSRIRQRSNLNQSQQD